MRHTFKKIVFTAFVAAPGLGLFPILAMAATVSPSSMQGWVFNNNSTNFGPDFAVPPPVDVPSTREQCMNNGWETLKDDLGHSFKNQGDCVSFVATKGKNQGSL